MEKVIRADSVNNEDYYVQPGVRSGAVSWGTAYKPAGRGFDSKYGNLECFVDLLLPPWVRLSL
jgi:hypothetical protein